MPSSKRPLKLRAHILRPPANEDWRARLAEAEAAAQEAFASARKLGPFGVIRGVLRLAGMLAWTLLAIPVQAVLRRLAPAAARRFARTYHATLCLILGLEIRLDGAAEAHPAGRPVVFVSNHSSWLDVLVLGATLEAAFVAKAEVGTWPVIRTVARLGRTVFVSRRRAGAGREAHEMAERLAAGESLILFPEGTTSDGTRVLPFRSALLGALQVGAPEGDRHGAVVQPVSVVYDRLNGLPVARKNRPTFAWYGDMEIASHAWRLATEPTARVTVRLHQPIDPEAFASRKALTEALFAIVSEGAASLRTGRRPRDQDSPGLLAGPAPGASSHHHALPGGLA
jgi:1-acyl-sn-glycerol-3-phosphate acyltransferase